MKTLEKAGKKFEIPRLAKPQLREMSVAVELLEHSDELLGECFT